MKYILSLALLLMGCGQIVYGQQANNPPADISYIDVLYMKDGSEFRGTIMDYTAGESVKMRLLGGQVIVFATKRIKKIVQERQDCVNISQQKIKKEYSFREKGIYNTTSISTFNSTNRWGEVVLGLSLNHVTGYQINRFVGVGIGSGVENYSVGSSLMAIPLYLETRGYVLKKNSTPYYSMQVGVAFPLKKEQFNISGGNAGVLLYPAVGYRLGSGQVNFTMDVGFKYQKLAYEYSSPWDNRIERNTFKRLAVRLGVLF